MGLQLVVPHHHFLDPLVEDLALLLGVDLSLGSLGENLSLALPLVAASVHEAVLGVVVAGVVPSFTLVGH